MSDKGHPDIEEDDDSRFFNIRDLQDPSYKGKNAPVEPTDRTTRQGQPQAGFVSQPVSSSSSTGSKIPVSTASRVSKTQTGSSSSGTVSKTPVSSASSVPKMDEETKQFLGELKDVFKDVASQNKKDNVLSLNDLPFFGIKPSDDPKKWVIPQEDSELFLEMLDKQTEDIDFTEAGRIRVLKTHLLGNALCYWKSFKGKTWKEAKDFLMARYPNINDYNSYMDRVKALKRKPAEQFVDFATRVEDAWDKVQKESKGTMSDEQIEKDKKLTLVASCPDEIQNFLDVGNDACTYDKALTAIIKWLELNKQFKLTRADIDKCKGASSVKQVAATVDTSKANNGGASKQPDPVNKTTKKGGNKKKSKNKHQGLTCYYCNKKNHISLNCRIRIAKEGDPNAKPAAAAPVAASTGGTSANSAGGASVKSGPIKCYNCGGEWHLATSCLKPKGGF